MVARLPQTERLIFCRFCKTQETLCSGCCVWDNRSGQEESCDELLLPASLHLGIRLCPWETLGGRWWQERPFVEHLVEQEKILLFNPSLQPNIPHDVICWYLLLVVVRLAHQCMSECVLQRWGRTKGPCMESGRNAVRLSPWTMTSSLKNPKHLPSTFCELGCVQDAVAYIHSLFWIYVPFSFLL